MALTPSDLGKIEASVRAIVEMAVLQSEKRMLARIQLLQDVLASRKQLEEIKFMLTEDVAGAYERIDDLETRVKKLEAQVAALA